MATWDENVERAVAQNRRNAGLPPQAVDHRAMTDWGREALEALIVEIEDDPALHATTCPRFFEDSDDCTCDVGPVTDLLRDRLLSPAVSLPGEQPGGDERIEAALALWSDYMTGKIGLVRFTSGIKAALTAPALPVERAAEGEVMAPGWRDRLAAEIESQRTSARRSWREDQSYNICRELARTWRDQP